MLLSQPVILLTMLILFMKIWNGEFFDHTSLALLGLCIQLGHDGHPCPNPVAGPNGFMVFDLSGVHFVHVNFCDYYTPLGQIH